MSSHMTMYSGAEFSHYGKAERGGKSSYSNHTANKPVRPAKQPDNPATANCCIKWHFSSHKVPSFPSSPNLLFAFLSLFLSLSPQPHHRAYHVALMFWQIFAFDCIFALLFCSFQNAPELFKMKIFDKDCILCQSIGGRGTAK